MSDPTKIRGFRNISTPSQVVFITEGGEAKISQISPRRWKVLPRGGEAYEVSGKQEAIEEARGIASGVTRSHVHELSRKHRELQQKLREQSLTAKPRRAHSTIRPEDGFLGSRPDGTALPMLRGEHYQNVGRAARHPIMKSLPRHKDVFQKLLEGQETLGEDEVRVLRHAARHPDFAGSVSRSLGAAADLHEAARLSDEKAAVRAEERAGGRRSLTPSEIQRDIRRAIGDPYPPRPKRR